MNSKCKKIQTIELHEFRPFSFYLTITIADFDIIARTQMKAEYLTSESSVGLRTIDPKKIFDLFAMSYAGVKKRFPSVDSKSENHEQHYYSNHNELGPVEYGRLVGAWESGGWFAEIGSQFLIPKETVRDAINLHTKANSPLPSMRNGAQKNISIEQETHLRIAIRRNPVNNYTDNWKAAVTTGLEVSLATYRKCIKEMGSTNVKSLKYPFLRMSKRKRDFCGVRIR
ncbi:uncharacterized protein EV154DRAFT_481863 [Mucor mucedo]|uniref:uncharacterized protein n=1 Tax=Mucor mucedo TaxID=29922 RepID=UPI00221FEF83|nr:uncharacterized protein EV154DRAFT_481863 [Mucor mucedo]KAI7890737.1 hypothetical protein EV154DRAFT_481863 [Mucor mucedo]